VRKRGRHTFGTRCLHTFGTGRLHTSGTGRLHTFGVTSVLRRYFVGAALVVLAACSAPQDEAVEPVFSYRNQTVPIGVTSRFDAAKFAGPWQVRQVLPAEEKFGELRLITDNKGTRLRVAANVCDGAGICGTFAEDLATTREGRGRYIVTMPDGKRRKLWVLWVDEGFRTAVIGNPAGTYAWVLDRSRTGGADRIKAAREILDFNGYDPRQLKVVK